MSPFSVIPLTFTFLIFTERCLSQCITSYSSDVNYFPDGYNPSQPFIAPELQTTITSAQKFSVQYYNAYKLVYNKLSETTYFLYECGAPVTSDYNSSQKPIQIPVGSIALDATIPVGYLQLLGLLPLVKAVYDDSFTPYVVSPCFQKLLQQGSFQLLNATNARNFSGLTFSSLEKKTAYNASSVYFGASEDPGPLRRAEWIKYLAVFFNLEPNATAIYKQIEANYQCLNGSSRAASKPTVAWISEYPAGVMLIDSASYKTQLTSDAGGLNLDPSVCKNYNLSVPSEKAAFHSVLMTVDVVIDESYAPSPSSYNLTSFLEKLQLSDNGSFPFLSSGRVWREDRRVHNDGVGLDWFEGSLPQPQIVLQELLGIFNPSTDTRVAYFFRNIAQGEGVVDLSASDCTAADPAAPITPMVFQCPLPASTPSSAAQVNILTASFIASVLMGLLLL